MMKLTTKLSIILGGLFLCIFAAGVFSLQQMNIINSLSTETTQNRLPAMVLLHNINTITSDFRRYETSHIYTENNTFMEAYARNLQLLERETREAIEKYKALPSSPEIRQCFLLMETTWHRYLQLSQKALKLSKDLKTEQAIYLLYSESKDVYNDFLILLTQTVKLNEAISKEASQNATEMYTTSIRLICFILLAAFILAGGFTFFLMRSTLRELGKDPSELQALARKIINGSLDIPADPEAVGVYADILTMVTSLKEHVASIETMTANIPGGVQCCIEDDALTMTYISDGFLALLGYSREELTILFNNQFIRLFLPEAWAEMTASLHKQLKNSNTFELEYSLPHKDGHSVWVLDRGRRVFDQSGTPLFYCVLTDITELRKTQKELVYQKEHCRAALCATHDIVFESDMFDSFILDKGAEVWATQQGTIPANYEDAYTQTLNLCHPEDLHLFSAVFEPSRVLRAATGGEQSLSQECRIYNMTTGNYWWCRSTVVPFLTADGQLDKLFGCLVDISSRKQEEKKILQVAQLDSLTGLYNKGFVEHEITHFLEKTGHAGTHALIMLDLDGFKSVNDNLGHLFGDAVLTDVSENIRKNFRATDITGRIGGDEFIILLKDIQNDPNLLNNKATALCTALHRTLSGGSTDYIISASIGISLYPEDSTTYRELYRKADLALYMAKSHGKNQYCYYTNTAETHGYGTTGQRNTLTDIANATENKSFQNDILYYIFELLYEARDIRSIVSVALGIIGKHYGVSRAYVFQNSDDNTSCSNTFEWCNASIKSEKENLQNISYRQTGNYLTNYTRDGVLYFDDISKIKEKSPELYDMLKSQGIKSLLHLAIFDNGVFRGYVGFDECNEKRLWTKDEIETLSILAKILGVFLIKEDISRQLIKSYNNITAILDSLDVWAYVIDEVSYELLYINAKTLALSPGTCIGDKCHSAFYDGCTTPCQLCPCTDLMNGTIRNTLEVYNNIFDVWILATASRIPWSDGKEAILLCCVDITHYKKTQISIPQEMHRDSAPSTENS